MCINNVWVIKAYVMCIIYILLSVSTVVSIRYTLTPVTIDFYHVPIIVYMLLKDSAGRILGN